MVTDREVSYPGASSVRHRWRVPEGPSDPTPAPSRRDEVVVGHALKVSALEILAALLG
jgi:hypothetical protein